MKRIRVLWHELDRPKHGDYLIDALCEAWQNLGLDVACVYGVRDRPEADLLIAHIDLTHTPPEYVEYIRSFPAAVNRDVVDISKRRISTHLLRRDEDFRGPVIVKTDKNSGGAPEYALFARRRPFLARLQRMAAAIAERAPGQRFARRTLMKEYLVFGSLAEVPAGVFRNRELVVEQFLPEREDGRYFVRHYICLGGRAYSYRLAGEKPFVKRPPAVLVDEGLAVPEPVLDMRRRLGLDYGKIDYTIHAGQVVILDVNRTPCISDPAARAHIVGELADGIWSLLPNRGNT